MQFGYASGYGTTANDVDFYGAQGSLDLTENTAANIYTGQDNQSASGGNWALTCTPDGSALNFTDGHIEFWVEISSLPSATTAPG